MSLQEQNEKVMRGWFEGGVWGAADDVSADAYIDAHYAADGRAYGIGNAFVEGPSQFKAFRAALVAAFPKQDFKVTHIHAHGHEVWLRWEATLTAADGKARTLIGGGVLEMIEGKIVKAWNLVNFLELLEEMGAVPPDALIQGFAALAKKSA